MAFWITSTDRKQADSGLEAGYAELAAGDHDANTRPDRGDFLVVYCDLTGDPDDDPVEAFTAMGRIADDGPEPFTGEDGETAYRRKVAFFSCIETRAHTLIGDLSFARDKENWRTTLVAGLRRIDTADFLVIAEAILPAPIFQKVLSVARDQGYGG